MNNYYLYTTDSRGCTTGTTGGYTRRCTSTGTTLWGRDSIFVSA